MGLSPQSTPALSVIVPTHNPRVDYLADVLAGLKAQSLPFSEWELILVDNASDPAVAGLVDLGWHPAATVVREDRIGLTRARVAGFEAGRGNLFVLVDDDNVLVADYLERARAIAAKAGHLGVWGGSIQPRLEDPALAPPESLRSLLTLRTVASDLWSNDPNHHDSTPWGAGLCVRRVVAQQYVRELKENPDRYGLDLKGKTLLYGGDTDIAYTACRMGLGKAVFQQLSVTHLIARDRCTEAHLCRVAFGRGYSEVLHAYALNKQIPPSETGLLRWLRLYRRRRRMLALECAVDKALEAGRQAAMRELAVAA